MQPQWYKRGRLAVDPRGYHVTMKYGDKTLLGEVVTAFYQDFPVSGYRLKVRHFNREPWPIDPSPTQVTVLEREYDNAEAVEWMDDARKDALEQVADLEPTKPEIPDYEPGDYDAEK